MNLDRIFNAKTMAVIGVSTSNESHPANVIYHKNRFRYPVKVSAVNPKGGILKREKLYKDVSEIPGDIDLAVIAARSEFVPDIIQSCIKKGVGGAVIVSGGFAESGNPELQQRMVDMAKEADFPFIGPNCLGVFSPSRLDTLFLPAERIIQPDSGNIAFISQSGGVMVDHMVKFAGQSIGMSCGVSIGNKALIREIELMNYFAQDPNTKVIVFYIEGFSENEGRKFVLAAKECPKPVIVIKGGRSSAGMRSVSSHTASIAGDYEVFSEIMKQYGVLEARNELELISYCESLNNYSSCNGNNIGIITVSGGHGVLAVDKCAENGLNVVPLSDEIKAEIKENLSSSIKSIASLQNPVDLTGSAVDEDFLAVANVMAKSPDIDCLLALVLPYSPGISVELGGSLADVCHGIGKPIIAYVPNEDKYQMLIEGFELNKVPVSSSAEGAVLMAKALIRKEKCQI